MAEVKEAKEEAKEETEEVSPGENIVAWFEDFIDLRIGSDRAGAVQSIVAGKQMRGSNAWMLVCSILIASLGLNLNSGAVIIGAMLISPLMNPILGVGLGVGTNDLPLLWTALKNFGISMAIALSASFLYFALTPIHAFTPEMQARTEPTILDALVAVFGGLAGIISVTREDKTNAIPGVAIATALMPPLCVAGYGLALLFTDTEQGFLVFWRSFYLFFINSFFIAVTAYIIIRLLRFPYRKYLTKKDARKSMAIVAVVSILMIIPSVYILQNVLTRQREERAALRFTEEYFPASLSSYALDRDENNKPLLIYPIKNRLFSRDSLDYYTQVLREPPYNLKEARIVTDTSLSANALAGIQMRISAMNNEMTRLTNVEYRLQLLSQEVNDSRTTPDVFTDTMSYARTFEQFRLAFPLVQSLGLSTIRMGRDSVAYAGDLPFAIVSVERQGRRPAEEIARREEQRMTDYLKVALGKDSVVVVVQEQ